MDNPSIDLELGPVALNAPLITFHNDLFIALHINTVRIVPALPTRIPPVSITSLSYRKPPNAAAMPVNEFNNDITTGISAPPIGKTNKMPYTKEAVKTIQINISGNPGFTEIKTIKATMRKTIELLVIC